MHFLCNRGITNISQSVSQDTKYISVNFHIQCSRPFDHHKHFSFLLIGPFSIVLKKRGKMIFEASRYSQSQHETGAMWFQIGAAGRILGSCNT